MATTKTTIDWQTGLQARGLWTLASMHYKKAQEFEHALSSLLKFEDEGGYCGHLSDAMWDGDFDAAIKKADIVIAPIKKKSRLK